MSGGKVVANQPHDRDRDRESLASTTTASHFSSSANNNSKKVVYLLYPFLDKNMNCIQIWIKIKIKHIIISII